jgi:hypothetical protein
MAIILFQKKSTGGGALPDQAGNAGKFLSTDGTNASWQDVNVTTDTISGSTSTFFYYLFFQTGVIRELVVLTETAVTFTLRINENPATDITITTVAGEPYLHQVAWPIISESTSVRIMNVTGGTLNYTFYLA